MYYVGQNLERRVKDWSLEPLQDMLTQVGLGNVQWPGPVEITPATPEELEQLRLTIYSLLHATGMKPYLTVKVKFGSLIVDMKVVRNKPVMRLGGQTQANPLSYQSPDRLPPLGDEGLMDIFTETEQMVEEMKSEKSSS